MSQSISPAVTVLEEDGTLVTQAVSSTIGCLVGMLDWGAVNEPFSVTSEADLVRKCSTPTDVNYKDWFTAKNFLDYTGHLRLIRVVASDAKNACDVSNEATAIYNQSHFEQIYSTLVGNDKTAKVFAKYPGVLGNKIVIRLADAENIEDTVLVNYADRLLDDNEVAVGVFLDGSMVEFGIYSKIKGTKDYTGLPNYVINAVNTRSSYVWLIDSTLITSTTNPDTGVVTVDPINLELTLGGGVAGGSVEDAERITGWSRLANDEKEDISLVMLGGGSALVGQYIANNIAPNKYRFACMGAQEEDVVYSTTPVDKMKVTRQTMGKSSHVEFHGNYKYQYDAYNDKYRWVPLDGDIAGLCAWTDENEQPWFSPAGKQIKNVVKLAFYPSKAERDEMYKHQINIVTSYEDEGVILDGDRTLLANSMLGKINVRRLMNYLEKAIARVARKVMYKQNDVYTRSMFVQTVDPFLRTVQSQRGVIDYKVIADERVNTDEVIMSDTFKAIIGIKPIPSINFVVLTFTATRYDVDFEEIIR